MNALDIILIIPIAWFGFKGLKNGLIKEIASLLAIVVGLYGAMKFSCYLEKYVASYTSSSAEYIPTIAFVICLIAIIVGVYLLSGLLNKFITKIKLTWLNKLGGLVFGVLKTLLILSSIILMINKFNLSNEKLKEDFFKSSVLYSPIEKLAPKIYPFINEAKDFSVKNTPNNA
ncbi:MAG: CvpA family protein [Bacteroidales bacterium]|nr:CvpA family protein [Bacteroidales bacterium]